MPNSENTSKTDGLTCNADYVIDALGLECPLPLLKVKQALNRAAVGEVVFVSASDPASRRDIAAYVQMTNHSLQFSQDGDQFLFRLTKGEKK